MLVLRGIVWYCMELLCILWYRIVLHVIALYRMVLHGIVLYLTVLHGIAWYCNVGFSAGCISQDTYLLDHTLCQSNYNLYHLLFQILEYAIPPRAFVCHKKSESFLFFGFGQLQPTGFLQGSHRLSARGVRRTKSRGPKGLHQKLDTILTR